MDVVRNIQGVKGYCHLKLVIENLTTRKNSSNDNVTIKKSTFLFVGQT